jgi:sugar phosphate isomerase/epimerase
MKITFSSPTTTSSEEEVLFTNYRECGYEGLQLKAGQYLSSLHDPDGALRAAGGDTGRFSGLIFGGGLDRVGQDTLRLVIDFATTVRSERVVFCHAFPKAHVDAADLRAFASVLSDLGSYARDHGTRLSLHHHYDQPVMFADDIRRFFGHVQPGSVGLTIDTAHMWMAGQDDVGATIEEFAGILDNVHLKDCWDDAPGERRSTGARQATSFMPLGQGELDFEPVFRALIGSGYSGWLCVDEESGADIAGSLKLSHDFVIDWLSREDR